MDGGRVDDGARPGVPEGADPAVDWPAEIRREQRRAAAVLLPVLGFVPAVVLLTGDFLGVPQPAAWWVAAVVGVVLVATGVVGSVSASRGVRPRRSAVLQVALRVGADPGPALRAEVDRFARGQRSVRWAWPCLCLGALGPYEQGRWGAPATAVPGAVLLVLFWGALLVNGLRLSAAAGRWLADPPGPPRPMPPQPAWERRRTIRVLLIGAPLLLALGFVAAVVVRVVTR